jgi:hypothetical protein
LSEKQVQMIWSFMRILRIAAMIILVALSLFVATTNGQAAYTKKQEASQSIDAVTKWEKRVLPVLDHVPNSVTELGYVADWDLPHSDYDVVDQDNEYTLTQYALAPRSVQPGLDHEWIIGNFTQAGFQEWLDQNLSAYEISEIGFGIYIIHRTAP